MSNIYGKIENLCKNNSINITLLCKESGASRGTLTDFKMGRIKNLSTDTLNKISNYFGVTVDYLLGNKEKPSEMESFSSEDIEIAEKIQKLTPEQRLKLEGYVDSLLNK